MTLYGRKASKNAAFHRAAFHRVHVDDAIERGLTECRISSERALNARAS